MKCDAFREELSAYLDGETGETLRVELEAHLADCAGCRQQLERLKQVAAGVSALSRFATTPQFLTEVRRKLAAGEEPVQRQVPAWVDALFRPVWLKLPLEALALVAVAATILIMQKPQPHQQLAAASPDRQLKEAKKVEVVVQPVVAAKPETPAPEPVTAPAPVVEDVARDEPKPEEPAEVVAATPVKPESAVDRLSPSNVEQRKDMAFNLPAPAPVAPVATPPDVAAAVGTAKDGFSDLDKSAMPVVDREVEQAVTNAPSKVFIAPVVIVHAGDFTKVRRQVETTAVQMGGQILSRTESQLNGKSGVVYTFQVQLPPGQVAAFRGQFASAKASEGARSRMGTPAVVQGELPAASTDTTVRSAIANQESVAAAKTKESPVVVEVQVVRPE